MRWTDGMRLFFGSGIDEVGASVCFLEDWMRL